MLTKMECTIHGKLTELNLKYARLRYQELKSEINHWETLRQHIGEAWAAILVKDYGGVRIDDLKFLPDFDKMKTMLGLLRKMDTQELSFS